MDQYSLIQRTKAIKKATGRPSLYGLCRVLCLAKCQKHLHRIVLCISKISCLHFPVSGERKQAFIFGKHLILNYLAMNCWINLLFSSHPSGVWLLWNQARLKWKQGVGIFSVLNKRNAANFLKWNDMILSEALSANDPLTSSVPWGGKLANLTVSLSSLCR